MVIKQAIEYPPLDQGLEADGSIPGCYISLVRRITLIIRKTRTSLSVNVIGASGYNLIWMEKDIKSTQPVHSYSLSLILTL